MSTPCITTVASRFRYEADSGLVLDEPFEQEQLNRYLMHFGLSPAARGRVQASNYVQPTLPGIDPKPETKPQGFAMFANPNR